MTIIIVMMINIIMKMLTPGRQAPAERAPRPGLVPAASNGGNIYIYIYIYICVYIYIYMYRERERERDCASRGRHLCNGSS